MPRVSPRVWKFYWGGVIVVHVCTTAVFIDDALFRAPKLTRMNDRMLLAEKVTFQMFVPTLLASLAWPVTVPITWMARLITLMVRPLATVGHALGT